MLIIYFYLYKTAIMTSHYQTTYHLQGIEIVGGKLNLNDGYIDGVSKICIGEWSFEVGDDGDLCIKNDDVIRAKITNNSTFLSNNIKYERFFMVQPVNIDDCIGLFVSNTNKFYNFDLSQSPTNDQSLPTIHLSSKKQDPAVIGVIKSCEKYMRELMLGAFNSVYTQDDEVNRVLVDTSGLGTVWVCDENGSLDNGDYITTSTIPGYGMKQEDDIRHNYTAGKITHNCNFNPETFVLQKPYDFDENGPLYEPICNSSGDPILDTQYEIKYLFKNGSKATVSDYENDLELLTRGGKKKKSSVLKNNSNRKVYKACLVGYI
jgi:hypothetical protein